MKYAIVSEWARKDGSVLIYNGSGWSVFDGSIEFSVSKEQAESLAAAICGKTRLIEVAA